MKGVITALVTPFKNGEIDLNGLVKNIEFQISSGIDGILPLGTTGESPTLTVTEKKLIIQETVKVAKNKCPIMVGTGSNSTQQTIENTKLAEDLGADSCLIVTPYYNKPTQAGIIKHFEAIANATKVPLIVYNIPGRAAINIEIATLKTIAELDSVIAVKEASGSINQIARTIAELQTDKFSVMSGDDSLTLPAMALGARGVISVLSNLIPLEILDLVKYCEQGEFQKASKIHFKLLELFKVAFIETNPIPIKSAMDLCGYSAGSCRLPLCEMGASNKIKLENVLKDLKIL